MSDLVLIIVGLPAAIGFLLTGISDVMYACMRRHENATRARAEAAGSKAS
jgi:hypothetical protein